jgi:hypothetical protein
MNDWLPVATHTMSEDEVRVALQATADALAEQWGDELRADGYSHEAVGAMVARLRLANRARIEEDLPRYMSAMQATKRD